MRKSGSEDISKATEDWHASQSPSTSKDSLSQLSAFITLDWGWGDGDSSTALQCVQSLGKRCDLWSYLRPVHAS